jgi:transcriptional regulatory protein GAL4
MIFATGAFDSATEDAQDNDGSHYYEAARAALQLDLFAEGSLVLVQGLAIMALYLQQRNKPNAGYVCLGLAIRMAMALGLHVSTPTADEMGLTVLESEMRSRIWWVLVAMEAGMCMTFGRPHAICLPSLFAVRLPVNIDDEHLTVSTIERPADAPYATRYTALITQARLAQMAFHTQDRISRSLPSPSVDQVKWCGDYFHQKLAALPAYMRQATPPYQFAQSVQIWRARDYRSIVYRPVYLSAAWSAGGMDALDDTVRDIVE